MKPSGRPLCFDAPFCRGAECGIREVRIAVYERFVWRYTRESGRGIRKGRIAVYEEFVRRYTGGTGYTIGSILCTNKICARKGLPLSGQIVIVPSDNPVAVSVTDVMRIGTFAAIRASIR